MKYTLLSIIVAAMTASATAATRSIEDMRSIAARQLQRTMSTADSRRAPSKNIVPTLVRVHDAYAIFAPEDGEGFVIVSSDDEARPVLGYSTTPFPYNDIPDGLEWYLQQIEFKVAMPRHTQATFTPVDNFVTTTWAQDYPFNKLTPNNYAAGCVATAIAQCMNYRQWPAGATFKGSYTVVTKSGTEKKKEDKEQNIASTYTWPYKDYYKKVGTVNDNIDVLLRDCGYATYMEYTSEGSGTLSFLAGIALTHTFGYSPECVKYLGLSDVASQDEWAQIIYDELAQRSPVFFGAADKKHGGHAFMLSGVDSDGMVYVNWGWRGQADGFFALTELKPVNETVKMNFSESQEIIYGIRSTPLPTDRYMSYMTSYTGEPYTFRWSTATDEHGTKRHALFCDLPYGFLNICPADFQGVFGIFADDLTDGTAWVIASELQDRDTIPSGFGYASSDESYKDFAYYYYIDGENGLKPGHTYRMSFGTCDDREGRWRSIMCNGGEVAYEVTYTGRILTSTISAERTTPPMLTGISALHSDRNQSRGNNASDKSLVSLITRVFTSDGRLVYTAPTSRFNLWDVPSRGILILDDGKTRRKVVR